MPAIVIIGVGTAGCKIFSMLDDSIEYDKILIDHHDIQIEHLMKYKEFIFVAPFGGLTGTILATGIIEKLHKKIFAKKVLITSMPLSFESEDKQILAKENIEKVKKYCQVFIVSDMNLTKPKGKRTIKKLFSSMDERFICQIETKLKTFVLQAVKSCKSFDKDNLGKY